MTLRSRDGLHVAIHEAALVDYAGMWLRRSEGQRLRAQLSPSAEGWKARRTRPSPRRGARCRSPTVPAAWSNRT